MPIDIEQLRKQANAGSAGFEQVIVTRRWLKAVLAEIDEARRLSSAPRIDHEPSFR